VATRAEAARRHASHYLDVLRRLAGRTRDGESPVPEIGIEREWPQIRRAREWSAAAPDALGRASLNDGFSRLAPAALGLALGFARARGDAPGPPAPPAMPEPAGEGAELRRALALARHALALSLQDGDRNEQAGDYAAVAELYERMGDPRRAAEYRHKACELRLALPDPPTG